MHIFPVTALQGWSTTSLINSIDKNVQRLKIWKNKIQITKSSCKNFVFKWLSFSPFYVTFAL